MSVDTTLAQMSNVLVYSSMAAYAGALLGYATDLSGPRPHRRGGRAGRDGAGEGARRLRRTGRGPGPAGCCGHGAGTGRAVGIATSLTWLAAGLHLVAVLTRGLSATRVPWGNMYEFSLTGSLVVSAVFLGLVVWRRDLRWLGVFAVGPVLLTLGLAVTVLYTESAQLVPALQSPFLVVHVSIAFISSALFTLGVLGARAAAGAGPPREGPRRRHAPAARPVHGPAAALGRPRGARLPAGGAVVPAVDVHARRRRDLGREGVGPVLGLGPQGGLDLRHLGGLRGVPARPRHPRVGRPPRHLPGDRRASSACC